ncbi:outer membrane protease [Chryseobacterium rhizosphaerae]|uniref:Outer membrane protease n=1 Tax=Chryseobacterium rhizosphaerae TaxID=395937 RepID=A0AAE4C465_9FLAO|nr:MULTISPECIES: hypothetical protein [Chryseobacterium]MBL3549441.1 hypothetical protein [Chryseobacterium sp. KMC2]MDR6529276.1 outer membrane protease [Chryseobacterium rhizosphaerae]MDR6548402.1 outer membrane protease [Chryseobacterium rhizosphaerae]
MKKTLSLLTLLFFIVLGIQVTAQAFTLEKIAEFNKLGMPEFKNEMKKINFSFNDKTESSDFTLNEYESPDHTFKIGKFVYTKDKSQDRIECEFPEQRDYHKYLSAVLNAGYKETGKGKIITKEPYVDYQKGKQNIRFILPKENQNGPYSVLVFK